MEALKTRAAQRGIPYHLLIREVLEREVKSFRPLP
jgi:predicted DNA binding CopG/RHH family protein